VADVEKAIKRLKAAGFHHNRGTTYLLEISGKGLVNIFAVRGPDGEN